MWQFQGISDDLRLCTFANTGRSKQDNVDGHTILLDQQGILVAMESQFSVNVLEGIAYHSDYDQQAC